MGTIAPGRLHDVSNAADFVALTETNFEILTAEVFKHEPTYVAGVPRAAPACSRALGRMCSSGSCLSRWITASSGTLPRR